MLAKTQHRSLAQCRQLALNILLMLKLIFHYAGKNRQTLRITDARAEITSFLVQTYRICFCFEACKQQVGLITTDPQAARLPNCRWRNSDRIHATNKDFSMAQLFMDTLSQVSG